MKVSKTSSFLVRLEHKASTLHITAQNIHTGEQKNFASFDGLLAFFDASHPSKHIKQQHKVLQAKKVE